MSYRKSKISCPVCQANQIINIPDYIFQQKQLGIINIQVRPGIVCQHEFIAYIDQKGKARGYETVDFQIQFTARTAEEQAASDQMVLEDLLEALGDFATLLLFHAFLFNYKIFILVAPADNPLFVDKLNDLFSRLFPASLQPTTLAEKLRWSDFATLDIKELPCLVLNPNGLIVNSTCGEQKKFDFESELVKNALKITTSSSQFLYIQQEIDNLKKKAEDIIALLEKTEMIYEDELKDELSKQFNTKLTDYLMNLYIQFIKQHFPDMEPQLNKIHDRRLDNLRDGIW